jgi:hypothetical protein
MQEVDYIESMKILEIKENDVLIIKSKYKISNELRHNIKKAFYQNLPDVIKEKCKIIVIDDEIDIGVIRINPNERKIGSTAYFGIPLNLDTDKFIKEQAK